MQPTPVPAAGEAGELLGMTELTEALCGPNGHEVEMRLLARLDELLVQASKAMETGLPPQEFERYNAIRKALASARAIVMSKG